MGAVIQFVDSLAADATCRLDVNDGLAWFCQNFSAPPPRLRRSVSQNAMRDGQHVSASSYEARTLTLELTLIEDISEEFAAQSMQALWRELDRPDNWLLYQPALLDAPVFFRLSRSDVSEFEELWTSPIARNITIELVAEPFALGLPESLGPFTVNNDPAAATNALRLTIPEPDTLGDVEAPLMLCMSESALGILVATGAPQIAQAEAASLYVDTTVPGGGPDAAMSGTGSNNYATTTFATDSSLALRVFPSLYTAGRMRVGAFVRRSDSTSTFVVQARVGGVGVDGPVVTVPATTERQFVDLGVIDLGIAASPLGYASTSSESWGSPQIYAGRTSGAGSVQWDAFVLAPADSQTLVAELPSANATTVDGVNEAVYGSAAGGDILTFSPILGIAVMSGGFPMVVPNRANDYTLIYNCAPGETCPVTQANEVRAIYNPRYLYVRPSAS